MRVVIDKTAQGCYVCWTVVILIYVADQMHTVQLFVRMIMRILWWVGLCSQRVEASLWLPICAFCGVPNCKAKVITIRIIMYAKQHIQP